MNEDLSLPPFCRASYPGLFPDISTYTFTTVQPTKEGEAAVNFRVRKHELELSPNATFSVFRSGSSVIQDLPRLSAIAKEVIQLARTHGADQITLRLPPDHWNNVYVENVLEAFSPYRVLQTVDLNQVVKIATWTELSMSKGNRKRLRQCRDLGLMTRPAITQTESRECFSTLERNRGARGIRLSMSHELFELSRTHFPKDYSLYATESEGAVVAASALIRLDATRLYVFMWGHDPAWNARSPVVSLFEYLMRLSASGGFQTLDLGISSVAGQIDSGLARFKEGLGAESEPKRTLLIFVED